MEKWQKNWEKLFWGIEDLHQFQGTSTSKKGGQRSRDEKNSQDKKVDSGTRAIKISQLLNKMAASSNAEKNTFFIVKKAGGSTLNNNENCGNLPVLRF